MCGIFFSVVKDSNLIDQLKSINFELLKNRGPDYFEVKTVKLDDERTLVFASSVLSLRGGRESQVTKQPLYEPESGNILLWNGEIFASDCVLVNDDENDATKLFEKLNRCDANDERDFFAIFESIKGPYSFVYYVKARDVIYFGRDKLGRRSLLISSNSLPSRLTLR